MTTETKYADEVLGDAAAPHVPLVQLSTNTCPYNEHLVPYQAITRGCMRSMDRVYLRPDSKFCVDTRLCDKYELDAMPENADKQQQKRLPQKLTAEEYDLLYRKLLIEQNGLAALRCRKRVLRTLAIPLLPLRGTLNKPSGLHIPYVPELGEGMTPPPHGIVLQRTRTIGKREQVTKLYGLPLMEDTQEIDPRLLLQCEWFPLVESTFTVDSMYEDPDNKPHFRDARSRWMYDYLLSMWNSKELWWAIVHPQQPAATHPAKLSRSNLNVLVPQYYIILFRLLGLLPFSEHNEAYELERFGDVKHAMDKHVSAGKAWKSVTKDYSKSMSAAFVTSLLPSLLTKLAAEADTQAYVYTHHQRRRAARKAAKYTTSAADKEALEYLFHVSDIIDARPSTKPVYTLQHTRLPHTWADVIEIDLSHPQITHLGPVYLTHPFPEQKLARFEYSSLMALTPRQQSRFQQQMHQYLKQTVVEVYINQLEAHLRHNPQLLTRLRKAAGDEDAPITEVADRVTEDLTFCLSLGVKGKEGKRSRELCERESRCSVLQSPNDPNAFLCLTKEVHEHVTQDKDANTGLTPVEMGEKSKVFALIQELTRYVAQEYNKYERKRMDTFSNAY